MLLGGEVRDIIFEDAGINSLTSGLGSANSDIFILELRSQHEPVDTHHQIVEDFQLGEDKFHLVADTFSNLTISQGVGGMSVHSMIYKDSNLLAIVKNTDADKLTASSFETDVPGHWA